MNVITQTCWGENPDRLQKALINDLDKAARRFDNIQMLAWKHVTVKNALRAHIVKQTSVPHHFQQPKRRPIKRLRLAGVVVLASLSVVLLIGAALPNIVPLEQLLTWLDSTYGHHQVGKVVNLQESACGFTMTIKRLYANAAQMIIVYDLQAPKNHRFSNPGGFFGAAQNGLSLSDDYGHTFPISLHPGSNVFDGNNGGQLLSFDISELSRMPQPLSLHLSIASLYASEVSGSPTMAGCETIDPVKTPPPGVVMGLPQQGTTVHTDFKFNFTVPVQGGVQVMHLNKTVTSNGTSITLERVVIAPDEGTLVYVKSGYGSIATDLVVTVNGKEVIPGGEEGRDGGEQILDFANALHSQWTLTYTSNPAMREIDKFGKPVAGIKGIRGGPWVFTFRTP